MQRTFYTICELSEKEKHDVLRKYVPEIDMNKIKNDIKFLNTDNTVLHQAIDLLSDKITKLEEKNHESEKVIAALSVEIERLKANASQPSQMPSDKELVVKEITDSWEEINNKVY